ncbi:MAG: hypothetical protein WC348_04510 [Patescibacteria group bacterium]|jgi:hypothetical protein
MASEKFQKLARISFKKIEASESEIEDRVSHAFSLLFEETLKRIAEKRGNADVGRLACFNQRVSHNGR